MYCYVDNQEMYSFTMLWMVYVHLSVITATRVSISISAHKNA
jgi:hypothetical protein